MKSKKLTKNVVLIGLMGSGKTTVSKELAKRLKLDRYSTDEVVEEKEKSSIAKIVATKGWPYFREVERKVVKSLSRKKGVIIDCGGGVVLDPENFENLKKNGSIFHLKASPQVLYKRLKGDKTRPLMDTPNPLGVLKKIFKERLPLYNQADFIIDASDSTMEAPIVEILKKVS